jgi:hypothetical protein
MLLATSSWSGKSAKRVFAQMTRPSTPLFPGRKQRVDARVKPGYDEEMNLLPTESQ